MVFMLFPQYNLLCVERVCFPFLSPGLLFTYLISITRTHHFLSLSFALLLPVYATLGSIQYVDLCMHIRKCGYAISLNGVALVGNRCSTNKSI